MELMRGYPDKHFELAIVDPPYGIGEDGGDKKRNRGYNKVVIHQKKEWDKNTPDTEYFKELHRVSQNCMVFGANYFVTMLPKNSMGWVFWDKKMGGDFSDGELIYSTFNRALRKIEISCFDGLHGGHDRIHPTEKPIALYRWLLANYAKAGDKILDTHLGSMSHAIAAHYAGLHLTGCELDPDYFAAGIERVKRETAQMDMFADSPKIAQPEQLFLDTPSA